MLTLALVSIYCIELGIEHQITGKGQYFIQFPNQLKRLMVQQEGESAKVN